jgi:transcriptional regulator of NAD metabolism
MERPMDLPDDIRRKIEENPEKETFLQVVERLQKEGVVITHDVLAAIQATIDLTEEVIE